MLFRLDDVAWVAGGTALVKLSTLPPGWRVKNILLHADLSGTKDAGDLIAPASQVAWATSVKLGRFFNETGLGLRDDNRRLFGKLVCGGLALGGGTTWASNSDLYLQFHDPRRQGATDGCVATELLATKTIELGMVAATYGAAAVGNLAITAGTIRISAELIPESNVSELVEVGFWDSGSLTSAIPGGRIYTDLYITDGSAIGTVTPAEITDVTMSADGQPVLTTARHDDLTVRFNRDLTDAASELTLATADFLDLVHLPVKNGQASKGMAVEKGGQVQLAGTITAPRFHYRAIVIKDYDTVAAVAAAVGKPVDGKILEPQVASKSAVRAMDRADREGGRVPRKARLLSGALATKVRDTATPRGPKA